VVAIPDWGEAALTNPRVEPDASITGTQVVERQLRADVDLVDAQRQVEILGQLEYCFADGLPAASATVRSRASNSAKPSSRT
jgi:hypothetical protein